MSSRRVFSSLPRDMYICHIAIFSHSLSICVGVNTSHAITASSASRIERSWRTSSTSSASMYETNAPILGRISISCLDARSSSASRTGLRLTLNNVQSCGMSICSPGVRFTLMMLYVSCLKT